MNKLWGISFFVLIIASTSQFVFAQKVVTGAVLDAETGETLPSVTLFDFEHAEGTITNAAGHFELRLNQLPATIDVRHIGYESQRIEIQEDTRSPLEILLQPVTYTLEEVFVSDEDPAYNIMRKVIERKASWRKHLDTYSAESYSRFMLYSDFDLAQVQESIAMHHWKHNAGTRSYVRARRMRPVHSVPLRFATTQNIPNFYDDTIEVLGFRLVGPTHPDALKIYDFTLGGYHEQDGQRIYDIYFSPHSGLSTAFVGHIAVLDEEYVLLKAQMRPSPDNVMPAPVQDWDVFYEQQFAPIGDSLWLPVDFLAEGHVEFGRLGVDYPVARYRQTSRLTHHVINIPVPDSLFATERMSVDAPNVDRQDYLFRWNPGLIPMTPKEIEEVVTLDPRMTLGRSFRPMGVLANYTAIELGEDPPEERAETRENFMGGMYSSVRFFYDRVDGYYLGLGRSMKLGKPLTLNAAAGYGLSSELPAYDFSLRYDLGQNTKPGWFFHKLYLKGGLSDTRAPQYASHTYSRLANATTTYIGWVDYFDYYARKSTFGEIGFISERLKSTLSLRYAREDHESIEAHRDRKGWFFGHTQRANPAIAEGEISTVTASLEIGQMPMVSMKAGGKGLRLSTVHNTGYNTDFPAFTRYTAEAALSVPTFFSRRIWPNTLSLKLLGTWNDGTLPAQYASILEVSRRPIAGFGAFKTLHDLPIRGNRVWAAYWEHDFSTSVFEILGLWGIARNGIGFRIHGAHGQALASDGLKAIGELGRFSDKVHHEIGVSFTHFFNMPFRIDITKNLNRGPVAVGLGLVKKIQ